MEKVFKCDKCNKIFTTKQNLNYHTKNVSCTVDQYTCEKCNKTFIHKSRLEAHKKRKNPCDIVLEVKDNYESNECKFCGRSFCNKQVAAKHSKTCKAKTTEIGIDILTNKINEKTEAKLKEKIRSEIMEEVQCEITKMFEKRLEELEKRFLESKPTSNNINNGTIINGNVDISVKNNYNTPNTDWLVVDGDERNSPFYSVYKQHVIQTPVYLVPLVWYNEEHPENMTVDLINKKTNEASVHVDKKWITESCEKVTEQLRNISYDLTLKYLETYIKKRIVTNEYILSDMERNRLDSNEAQIDCDKIRNIMIDNRNVVRKGITS